MFVIYVSVVQCIYVYQESDGMIPKLKVVTIVLIQSKSGKIKKETKHNGATLVCEQLSMAK